MKLDAYFDGTCAVLSRLNEIVGLFVLSEGDMEKSNQIQDELKGFWEALSSHQI